MKILITGANGYLGQGITKELLDIGHIVIASDIVCDKVDKRAIIKDCDLFNIDNPFEYFEQPDAVLHCAWRNGFVHNDYSHITDLSKHFMFLEKLINSGIKELSVLGSMHEVGFFEGCVDENTPTNPLSLYGISKNALRQALQILCSSKDVTFKWLRGFYIIGNKEYGNSIFSKIYKAAKENNKLFPFTTGKNKYDFLDYDIFCRYVAKTVSQNKVNGIINICSGEPIKLSEKVEQFIKDNELDIKLDYGKFPDRPYDSKELWGDNSKIKEIIGE